MRGLCATWERKGSRRRPREEEQSCLGSRNLLADRRETGGENVVLVNVRFLCFLLSLSLQERQKNVDEGWFVR
jgi:hypothetical protein